MSSSRNTVEIPQKEKKKKRRKINDSLSIVVVKMTNHRRHFVKMETTASAEQAGEKSIETEACCQNMSFTINFVVDSVYWSE